MKKILDYLEQLDLSDVEAKLYLSLLNTGPTSVRDLAATIDIKRTTTYLYIDQLIEKGLIMKVVKGSQKLVAANDPKDSLEFLVKRKLQTAITVENEFPDMLKALATSLPQVKEIGDAEVKFYKGINGVKKIYEEALQANELRSFANIAIMDDVFPENLNVFADAFKKNKTIKMYEIVENSPQSKKAMSFQANNDRFFYKFIPNDVNLSSADTLIYDGKVSIINAKSNISGVVLRNSEYYNNSKELFDFMWRMLPEIKS